MINGEDFTCHTRAVKDPVKHIATRQIFFSILLYSLHQRMYENIKPDGQKCHAWIMILLSESVSLQCIAFPADILMKEVPLRKIGEWIQYSHSFTHEYFPCLRCDTQWRLTGCSSPNCCKTFSIWLTKVENSCFMDSVKCYDFFFYSFVCVRVTEFGTSEAEDTAGCSKPGTENTRAEARDKGLWIANNQSFSGRWQGMNQCRKCQHI